MRLLRRRHVVRTAASVGQTAAPAASAIISLLAVQAAGIAAWGQFVTALVLVRLWAQVANFGSRDYLLRGLSREPGTLTERWQQNVVSRLPLLVPGPFLFLALGTDPPRAAAMTVWLVALYVAQSHDAVVAFRRAFGFALGAELVSIALTVGAIVAVGPELSAEGLIIISALVTVLRAGALVLRFRVLDLTMVRCRPELAELRGSWPFFALSFSGAIQSRVDLYVVAALLPAVAVGQYALLTNFVLLVQSMAGALLAPLVPPLYRLARGAVLLGAARLFAAGIPLTLAGAAGTLLCLRYLYGVEITTPTLVAAWAAMLPCYLYLPLVYLCFREGRERAVVAANLLGTGIGLVGALLLAPRLGIAGAMGAAALAQAAIAAFHVVLVLRPSPIPARAPGDALPGM